jgi:hypothetical protein
MLKDVALVNSSHKVELAAETNQQVLVFTMLSVS